MVIFRLVGSKFEFRLWNENLHFPVIYPQFPIKNYSRIFFGCFVLKRLNVESKGRGVQTVYLEV